MAKQKPSSSGGAKKGNQKSVKGPSSYEKSKSYGVNKTILGVAGCCVIIAVVIAVAVVIVNDSKIRERDRSLIAGQQDYVNSAITSIDALLGDKGVGAAKVYDADGNQLFTIRDTQGISPVGNLPESLKAQLWGMLTGSSNTPSKIDLDAWSNSHTVLGGSNGSKELLDFTEGSFGWAATECWVDYAGLILPEESRLAVAASLEEKYSSEQLFTYIVSCARFGNSRGVLNASDNWFGKSLDKLNQWQQAYLLYAFLNPGANWDGFIEVHPESTGGAESATAFGFTDAGDPYWLLRRAVQSELSQILGSGQLTEEYSVRLKINPRIQADLQSAIDSGMASSIALNSMGQTVLDGTAVCVDARTGFVVALVGGRSRNIIASQLEFPVESNVGVYKAAGEMLANDSSLTYNSLLSYNTLSGQQEWGTFGGIISAGQLGLLGQPPVVESSIKLEEVTNFMAGLYVSMQPRCIEQVLDSGGKVKYSAPSALDVSNHNANPDIRCLLMGDTNGTYCEYAQVVSNGLVAATGSTEFIIAGLYGTSAQGYSLSDSDYSMCLSTASNALNVVGKYFPSTPATIDPEGKVAEKVKKSQEQNATFITELVEGWVKELTEMPINSVETRQEFEYAYSYYSSMVPTYKGVVDTSLLDELTKKVDAVRVARADELIQYAN